MNSKADDQSLSRVLQVYLEISQYPVLSHAIREQMREELFSRGVISREDFETEVARKTVESQRLEGLTDPLVEEPPHDWDKRVRYIRAHLTDFYFAYNLPYNLFRRIVHDVLQKRAPQRESYLSFNPEIAPLDMLFEEGERYERMPPDERSKVQHHLREIIVVLLKAMVSDHLGYVGLAKEVFTIKDLKSILERRLGRGKIGGKAAGMLLAWRLLQQAGEESGVDPALISIPESYYVGCDVFYDLHELNNLFPYMNQKYKTREEIVEDYPRIREVYAQAELPEYFEEQLHGLLEEIGKTPVIFRSSSLLEDNFKTAFARKYESYLLPNQGTLDENFREAKAAILKIYAGTVSPEALIYRQEMGLVDFDERMAILIQKVEGQRFGRYFYPMVAGVGFSRNPFRWSPMIRRQDGLLRLVCGLGTRAVDRVDYDYPRMVALSHPHLRPEAGIKQMRQYSQHFIDVLDMEDSVLKTLPIREVIDANFPALRLVALQDNEQYLQPFMQRPTHVEPEKLVFTLDPLAEQKSFTTTMRNLLAYLQKRYQRPVDIEFAVEITRTWPEVNYQITLLQCRPLSEHEIETTQHIPRNIPTEHKLFSANRQVPEGIIERIRYVGYVNPEAYYAIREPYLRLEIARLIGRINQRLKGEEFILMGPGRWGTSNGMLGVQVSHADIYNTRALIEIAFSPDGSSPEMAYGTHFFQDLVEAKIFPLALFPREEGIIFNWDFFDNSPNILSDLLPDDAELAAIVNVVDVPAITGGRLIEIIMDTEHDMALGYLKCYD